MSESVKEGYIDKNICRYISTKLHSQLSRSKLEPRNVVLTKTGVYFGKSAVVPDNFPIANTSAHVGKFVVKEDIINPYYLSTFFNCEYGYSQLRRRGTKASRPEIKLIEFNDIRIFVAEITFQTKIEQLVKKAVLLLSSSREAFSKAHNLLLTELGLNDWQPKHQLTFIRNYSATVAAGRIDAEYFQPKYDEIINAIKAYTGGYSTISKEFRQNKSTFETDNEKLYKYVEIGSINVSNGEVTPREVLGANLPANAKRTLNKNDIIVSKVRTYRGAITIVEKDGYVGSGAFTALTEGGRVNKETLLAFLHSKPLLYWSLKPNTGTSYPVIVDDDILNLSIPILPQAQQLQIQQQVTESYALRKQSKQLLENAKHAVEIAIEQNESQAIEWLAAQLV